MKSLHYPCRTLKLQHSFSEFSDRSIFSEPKFMFFVFYLTLLLSFVVNFFVYFLSSEGALEHKSCGSFKILLALKSKQKLKSFFLRRSQLLSHLNRHNKQRHDQNTPQANEYSYHSSQNCLWIKVPVSHSSHCDNDIPK